MEKLKTTKLNKTVYLLGKHDGKDTYLVAPSWDLGWYWGFGYLQTYMHGDIDSHTHFDFEILSNGAYCFDTFKNYFEEATLTDDEIWILCDYMKTFYTLRETAEVFRHGYSYITGQAYMEEVKSKEIEEKINKEILPQLFKKIDELLTGEEG